MAQYKILGRDPYWMNFYGLMILTAIEVGAVGADMSSTAEALNMSEDGITLWIPVSYTHLTLPTIITV